MARMTGFRRRLGFLFVVAAIAALLAFAASVHHRFFASHRDVAEIEHPAICAPTQKVLLELFNSPTQGDAKFLEDAKKAGAVLLENGDHVTVTDHDLISSKLHLWNGAECWVMNDELEGAQ